MLVSRRASTLPVKKIKTEYGAITSVHDSNAESDLARSKRKIARRRPKTGVATSTSLLDLNEDCLYKIFNLTRVSLFDFYSLSQTCTRLNEIGSGIFQRKVKVCDFRHITDRNAETIIGVLKTFRSVISELRLRMYSTSYSNSSAILDSIIRYCTELKSLTIEGYQVPNNQNDIRKLGFLFKNLEQLHLEYVAIEEFDDENELIEVATDPLINNLFSNCQSLISLKVIDCYHFKRAIFESSFLKLEHFDYKSGDFVAHNNVKDFISRHRNLKSFRLDRADDNNYLDILAAGCKNLTNLKIRLDTEQYPRRRSYSRLTDSVKSLANFQQLKELTVESTGYDAATKLVKVLPKLSQSLECLHVEQFSGSLALIPAVVQLKNLRIFRLHEHSGYIDINRIGELTQLVEVSLIDVEASSTMNLIKMVNDLGNLKKLKFLVNGFRITNELYAQLLDVLKRREPEYRHLDLYCLTAIDFVREFCQTQMVAIKF